MRVNNLEKVIKRKTDPEFDLLIDKLHKEHTDEVESLVGAIGTVFNGAYSGSDAFDLGIYRSAYVSEMMDDSYEVDSYEELDQVKELFANDLVKSIENKPIEKLTAFSKLYELAKYHGFKGEEFIFADKLKKSMMFKEIAQEVVKESSY